MLAIAASIAICATAWFVVDRQQTPVTTIPMPICLGFRSLRPFLHVLSVVPIRSAGSLVMWQLRRSGNWSRMPVVCDLCRSSCHRGLRARSYRVAFHAVLQMARCR